MSTIRFDGKVAIVTGAGGGLGKAYAQLLAARGAKVLVNDLGGDFAGQGVNPGYAQAAAAEIRAAGGIAEANTDSVADTKGANAIVQQALDTWGRVDILVNNAGVVTSNGSLSTVTDENYAIDMNVAAAPTDVRTGGSSCPRTRHLGALSATRMKGKQRNSSRR